MSNGLMIFNWVKAKRAGYVILFISICLFQSAFSQKQDSLQGNVAVHGAISVTNNGISFIPTFMLGKPATIFDLSLRKNRFSFEPQFRFAIKDAKPWSFVFWLRYKLIEKEKLKMGIGVHPSTVFRNTTAIVDGISKELITVNRYFAGEITPTYFFSKNINFGVYYLYSRGLAGATRNTNFAALSASFSNIKLVKELYLKVIPQIYFLKMDEKKGYYATSAFNLSYGKFPVSVSSIVNKKIESTIQSKSFVWNISLVYSY